MASLCVRGQPLYSDANLTLQLAGRMSLLVSPPVFFFLTSASLFSSDSDGFVLGEVVTSAHAQNVLYCVASNFLEVKQLASTLLRQLPPSAVGLQVDMRAELSRTTAMNSLTYPQKNKTKKERKYGIFIVLQKNTFFVLT